MPVMIDGFVMGPGEGERVSPAMTLKVGGKNSPAWSMFEVADIGPGFDVGAHLHPPCRRAVLLEGQLDLLAFEPRVRPPDGWQGWESHTGATVARGGPGSMMYVPRGCPHAFANPGPGPDDLPGIPSGHEHYQKELAALVASTYPAPTQQVGQSAAEQQEPAERQRVSAEHPLQPDRREPQPALDGRQGQCHDRPVEDHQQLGQQDQAQCQALVPRPSVPAGVRACQAAGAAA